MLRSAFLAVAALACVVGCGVNPAEIAESSEKRPRSSIGLQRPPDQEIQQRLAGILRQIDGLEDVTVRVHEGVVHLAGTTETAALEQRALIIAMRLEHVAYVNDEITQPAGMGGIAAAVVRTLARMGRGTREVLPRLGSAVIVFLPFAVLSLLLARWRRPFRVFGVSALRGGILRATLRWLMLGIGLVLALDLLGIAGIVGAVFGALGIVGLVAGFVFKDWIAQHLPGLSLGLHPPFQAGDLIQLGKHEGRVVRITPRATVLMTPDGEEVRLPNSMSFHEPLVNYSHHRVRRLRFTLALAPRADFQIAQEAGCATLRAIHGVVQEPPPFMRIRALERDLIEVEFFAWVAQHEINFRTVESMAKRLVFESLTDHGVPLPEKTLIVHRPPAPKRGGVARAADGSTAAEDQDRAFVDEQLAQARAVRGERDLLEDSKPARR